MNNRYDNTAYWRTVHERHPGQLRGVGHPWLCEAANRLKYESEADTLARAFGGVLECFAGKRELEVLDIGAGTGFWTALVRDLLLRHGIRPQIAALDISREALAGLARELGDVQLIEADLKRDTPAAHLGRFDLVTAMYCLHHLARRAEFENGLRYAAGCVRSGGCLVIMDPVLSAPYSPFSGVDESAWDGNGMPRSQAELDETLRRDGFRRLFTVPAVSFLLNGPIEAAGKGRFALKQSLWRAANVVFRNEATTRLAAPAFRVADRALKGSAGSGSSSLCVYRRDP